MTSYYAAERKNTEPSAATEHTGEPQLGGYASNATEHADDTSLNQGSARSEDEQIVATEHVHVEELDILLTMDDASQIRRTFRGQTGAFHTEARRHLNEITDIAGQDGADDVYYIDDSIRSKDASHETELAAERAAEIAAEARWTELVAAEATARAAGAKAAGAPSVAARATAAGAKVAGAAGSQQQPIGGPTPAQLWHQRQWQLEQQRKEQQQREEQQAYDRT